MLHDLIDNLGHCSPPPFGCVGTIAHNRCCTATFQRTCFGPGILSVDNRRLPICRQRRCPSLVLLPTEMTTCIWREVTSFFVTPIAKKRSHRDACGSA